jgi:hypothetical protein
LLCPKLVCIVDDASRLCIHAGFYRDEQVGSLLDALTKAITNFGRPRRLLGDNGPAFRSTALALSCAQLPIELSFCRPFSPSSKGKIERFIRTIKDDLYQELLLRKDKFDNLEDLNYQLQTWVESYNNRTHAALDRLSPLARWTSDEKSIEWIKAAELSSATVLRHFRKVSLRTALVDYMGIQYQVAPTLAGKQVEIRHNPCSGIPTEIEVWHDGHIAQAAKAVVVQSNIDFSRRATMRSPR